MSKSGRALFNGVLRPQITKIRISNTQRAMLHCSGPAWEAAEHVGHGAITTRDTGKEKFGKSGESRKPPRTVPRESEPAEFWWRRGETPHAAADGNSLDEAKSDKQPWGSAEADGKSLHDGFKEMQLSVGDFNKDVPHGGATQSCVPSNEPVQMYEVEVMTGPPSVAIWKRFERKIGHTGTAGVEGAAGAEAPSLLPNADQAVIDAAKIKSYALNPGHPVGRNKARVFDSALGFNQSNADEFINQVQQGVLNNPATLGKLDNYGQRYTVIIPMTGPNGSTVPVLTGWIFDPGSTIPRLTTTYVK
jgi:filamentous hemagglutinin